MLYNKKCRNGLSLWRVSTETAHDELWQVNTIYSSSHYWLYQTNNAKSILDFIITSCYNIVEVIEVNEEMNFEELKQFEINKYIDLIRIKKHQKETNIELDYQLKTQKNKLNSMGVNTQDFEYDN